MSTHDMVEHILQKGQVYRDSDKWLLVEFWSRQGLELTSAQIKAFIENCTTAETITRARRALKNKYPASKEIDDERFNKFKHYKNDGAVSWL